MATTTPSAALVPVAHVFTNTERLAVAGFLAGYGLLGREVAAGPHGPRQPGIDGLDRVRRADHRASWTAGYELARYGQRIVGVGPNWR
jgi:hypothetical protein